MMNGKNGGKNKMINPKNKRVQVTLPGETAELLESLSNRYNKSNSEIVKWAINVLAAKKRHNIVIKLSEQQDKLNSNNDDLTPEEEQRLLKIINELEPPKEEDEE